MKKQYFWGIGMIVGCMILSAACTPASVPSDSRSSVVSADSSVISEEQSSSDSSLRSEGAASSVPDTASQAASQSAQTGTAFWDDSHGKLIEISFRYVTEGSTNESYYRTDDSGMLEKLENALKDIRILAESEERVLDDGMVILYTTEKDSGRMDLEHGGLVIDDCRYDISGYGQLESVLGEIKEQYPEWTKKYDTWIHKMSEVDDPLKELTTGSSYQNGDLEFRRSSVLTLLHQLEANGLIKEGSICDSGDNISFIYNCDENGVLGGVMLREFDPMMN